jgi:hypothetical protein
LITGKTFVSDAAASTVGSAPALLAVVLADAELVDDGDAAADWTALELETLLLPQPAARTTPAITVIAAVPRRAQAALTRLVSLSECQNAGSLQKSWRR